MDIELLDKETLDIFSFQYKILKDKYKEEPITASPRKQRNMIKCLKKRLVFNLSEDISGKSDSEIIEFLHKCYEESTHQVARAKELFDKNSAELSCEARDALWELTQRLFDYTPNGNAFTLEDNNSFRRTLNLINASGIPEKDGDMTFANINALTKKDGKYQLVGQFFDFDSAERLPFCISFQDAEVKTEIFNATITAFAETPWNHLGYIASDILEKHAVIGNCLNNREKGLIPLLAEITMLSNCYTPEESNTSKFSALKEYANKYRYIKISALLEKAEMIYCNEKKFASLSTKILAELNKSCYEPMWREIYEEIKASQTEYPSKAEIFCSSEKLHNTRADIERRIKACGYTGTYPDFKKTHDIKGVRLEESYNLSYFIAAEKNAVSHIHCTEEYFIDHLKIEFLCGTSFARKGKAANDIYSCLFNSNGRNIYHYVNYEQGYITVEEEIKSDDLSKRVDIAVKKAELKKLTKEEKKEFYDINYSLLPFCLFILIFGGGMFAILMTIAMMMITVIASLILGESAMIPSLLLDTIWLKMLAFSWIAFGGSMAVITALAKRK